VTCIEEGGGIGCGTPGEGYAVGIGVWGGRESSLVMMNDHEEIFHLRRNCAAHTHTHTQILGLLWAVTSVTLSLSGERCQGGRLLLLLPLT
jgi:hypothetical protein